MSKEEYGNLLKYLGILKYAIYQLRDQEREFEFKKEVLQAIELISKEIPILEKHLNN